MTYKKIRSLAAEVVLAGAAVWLVANGGMMSWHELRLRSGSQVVRAVVIAKDRPRAPRRTWSRAIEAAVFDWFLRGHPANYVTYRFELDGTEFLTEAPVSSGLWRSVRASSPLDVEYVTSEPAINRPSGQGVLWLSLTRFAVGACLGFAIGAHALTRLMDRTRPPFETRL